LKIKKISIIVGTRPQIIKSIKLVEELLKNNFDVKIIHTGQHYDYQLSKKFFKELKILNPTINLEIGKGTQLEQISKIIIKLEGIFKKSTPDLVIIPGDTTSAIASALAASKCHVKIAHLEAGARSNQFYMSEEINRRQIDHCSNILLAPTKNCLQNLKNELVFGKAFFVGDTMYDLFLDQCKKQKIKFSEKLNKKQVLVTIHRAENIKNNDFLKKLSSMLNGLSTNGYQIIFPVHPNTQKWINEMGIKFRIDTIEPIGYLQMLKFLAKSNLVITDSGGLQKEAYWSQTPCITLRESTEWIETINEKANFLFFKKLPSISKIEEISSNKIKVKPSLFGSGNASKKIASLFKTL